MLTRLGFVIVGMICLAASCRKDEPEPITRLIPTDMKAYWNFKVGTWWTYQDSSTGVIDTVKVIEYTNYEYDGTLSHSGEAALCEYLEILTFNTGDEINNRYSIHSSYSSPDGLDYNAVKRSKFGGGNGFQGVTKCFMYPLFIGNKTYNPLGMVYDTCTVKGFWNNYLGYDNVTMMYQNRNTVDGDQHTRTYWAKNIGIIRQELVDSNRVLSLVDYHIEP